MKKLSLTLAALALVLGMSQCKKQEEPVQNGEKQHIVLNASFAESNSKIAEDGFGGLKWSDEDGNEDHIIVKNSSQEKIGELECTDAENGIFEGDITSTTGNITFTFGTQNFTEQTGNLNAAIYLTAETEYVSSGNYDVTMNMPHAVLKLDVSALGTSGLLTIAAGGIVASVTDVSGIASAVFVAVPANNEATQYTFTCGDKTATKDWPALAQNTFYTKQGTIDGSAIVIEPDAPATPKFSVSATTTVEFAPGNLYWDGTESKFKFEANQWSTTPASTGTWDANHVSHFYWSKDAAEARAEEFNWDQSMLTDDVFFTNSTETTANPNFQVNGETAGTWRTLSKAEWGYLLNSRTSASSLRAWVTLTDVSVSGLVILPDGSSATASGITTSSALAGSGAVFLPAPGSRGGSVVVDVGSKGYYWSGTPKEGIANNAYCIYLNSGNVRVDYCTRNYGSAVRLVR